MGRYVHSLIRRARTAELELVRTGQRMAWRGFLLGLTAGGVLAAAVWLLA